MAIRISKRLSTLAPSATMAVAARARQLRDQGVDVISLGAGEPDFDTPEHIKQAAIAALEAGDTKYPMPVAGREALRVELCEYFRRFGGVSYTPAQVCVTVGGKDAIHLALAAVLDPDDEVIIPAPYWVSYPDQVRLAGARPIVVDGDPEAGGKLTSARLRQALTPRTRLLLLNSPCNPTGSVYSLDELQALADVVRERDLLVLSDELYHRLDFANGLSHSFAALEGMKDRTITINGFSKSYAMTGWRLGFAAAPEPVIEAMARMQGQTTSGAASFTQAAAIAALRGDQSCVDEMRAAYVRRGRLMWERLCAMPGVSCAAPQGAFYCFPNVSGAIQRLGLADADAFAAAALEKAHVALVSGRPFGAPMHARLSFATSDELIEAALSRLATMVC